MCSEILWKFSENCVNNIYRSENNSAIYQKCTGCSSSSYRSQYGHWTIQLSVRDIQSQTQKKQTE